MGQLHRVAVAATVGLALVGGSSTAAFAAPSPGAGIAAQRLEITDRINARLSELDALSTALGAAKQLSTAHRSTLTALVTNDKAGLTTLRTTVAGETTTAALKADAASMINDYRIFMLAGPQVRLTISGDLEAAAIVRLTPVVTTLTNDIAAAKKAGKDTTKAEADLSDLKAKLAAAGSSVAGMADTLLAVRPGPDANAIEVSVSTARQAVRASRADLKAAMADAKDIRAQLHG